MAEQFSDQRPRRRLFGRRRPEEEIPSDAAPENPQTAETQSDPEPVAETPASPPAPNAEEPVAEPVPVPERIPGPGPLPDPEPAPAPPIPTPEPEPAPLPNPEPAPGPSPEPIRATVESDPAPVATSMPERRPESEPVASVEPESEPETVEMPEPAPAPEPLVAEEPERVVPTPQVPEQAGEGPDAESVDTPEPEPVPLEIPRIIAIANQKGGVGKTTTAVNLGAALAESGLRVLVVDLDPQGNASTGLGINPRDVNASIYDVLMQDTPALDAVEPTSLKNLFVIPATLDLAGAEIELVPAFSRELKLKRALDAVRSEYDVVLIDCPPSLGLLTVNGLAAADDVIVPIQCEYYALEGLGQLLRNVALVRSSLNASLDVRGIILTMYDARTRLAEQVETEVREHFGAKVYKTVVPRTVRLAEAPSFGQPVIVFDSTSRGATAYRNLAKEVSGGATRRTG
jgi:chromosome partitioning protein